MAEHSRHRGRWTPRVRWTANAGLEVFAGAMRWKRTEINALRMAVAGVSLALPVTIGLLLGDRNAGVLAALGALLVAGSGHVGNLRSRANDLLATAVVASAGILVGMQCSGGGFAGSIAIFIILGTSLSGGAEPVWEPLATFVAGMLVAGTPTGI